jgi:hypothetical protein
MGVFYDEPCWKSTTASYQRDPFSSTCTPVVAVAGQNYPDSEGALSSPPIQPALKTSTPVTRSRWEL